MSLNDSVQSARKVGKTDTTGKTASGVSVFTTTVKDTLTTVDGYRRGVVASILSMKDGLLESIAKAKNWLMNVPIGPFGNIQEIMKKVVGVKNQVDEFRKEISSAITGAMGIINKISDETMEQAREIKEKIDKYTNRDYWENEVLGDITGKYNELVDQVNSVVLDAQNKIDSVKNRAEQIALDLGLMKDAASIGATDIVNSIMNKYPTEQNAKEVLGTAFPTAIYNGDLEMMANIIKWCTPEYVMLVFPDSIRMILMNFRFKPGTPISEYPNQADQLVAILESLDAKWDKYRFGLHEERNLSLFTTASPDTKSAFSYRPPFDRIVKVSERHIQGRTMQQISRDMYPMIAI